MRMRMRVCMCGRVYACVRSTMLNLRVKTHTHAHTLTQDALSALYQNDASNAEYINEIMGE